MAAKRYADECSRKFLESGSRQLKQRIVTLFRKQVEPKTIAEDMTDALRLDPEASIETRTGVVRRILATLMNPKEYKTIIDRRKASQLLTILPRAKKALQATMKQKGYFVWTDKQNEFFLERIQRKDMLRNVRLNHVKIADEMNKRFRTNRFTAKNCGAHYLMIRHEKSHAELQRVKRKAKKS